MGHGSYLGDYIMRYQLNFKMLSSLLLIRVNHVIDLGLSI